MVLSERFELRLEGETLDAVDEWRAGQQGHPTRSEAIRQLIDRGLAGRGMPLHLSAGERLTVLMLCDVLKSMPARADREFDPATVQEIVGGGHLWALQSEYSWAFNREIDNPAVVEEVYAMLEMWEHVEDSYDALAPEEQERVLKEVGIAQPPRYEGFDGNNDDHYGIAFFIIKRGDRFERFEKSLNSHSRATLPTYRRMLAVYKTIDPASKHLSASELKEVFKARIHPDSSRKEF